MPYTDWPKKDPDALVKDRAAALLRAVVDGQNLTLSQASRQAANARRLIRELSDQLGQEPN
jgi:hypothetical protein